MASSTGIPKTSNSLGDIKKDDTFEMSEASLDLVPAQNGSVLRGVTHTFVTFEATPTIFRAPELDMRQTGYHVRMQKSVMGSTVTHADFYNNIGLGVTVEIYVEDTSTLVITRRAVQSYVTLASALLGAISGLGGIFLTLVQKLDDFSLRMREKAAQIKAPKETSANLSPISSWRIRQQKNTMSQNWGANVEPLIRSGLTFCTTREIVMAIQRMIEAAGAFASPHELQSGEVAVNSPAPQSDFAQQRPHGQLRAFGSVGEFKALPHAEESILSLRPPSTKRIGSAAVSTQTTVGPSGPNEPYMVDRIVSRRLRLRGCDLPQPVHASPAAKVDGVMEPFDLHELTAATILEDDTTCAREAEEATKSSKSSALEQDPSVVFFAEESSCEGSERGRAVIRPAGI